MFDLTKSHVLHSVASLLRQVTFNPNYTEQACQLLWELGRIDDRPLNQYPDHPIRVLSDLAGYSHRKPLLYNEVALNLSERWVDDPKLPGYAYSPLDIIDLLLAKQAEFTRVEGHSFHLGTARLIRDRIEPLRVRALACVEKCLMHSHARVAARALSSLRKILQPPIALYGREIGEDERRQWDPERMKGAALLGSFIRQARSPALLAQAAYEFGWFAKNAKPIEIAQAVGEALADIPDSLEVRIATALTRGFFDIGRGDVENHAKLQQDFLSNLAKDFTGRFTNEGAVTKLEEAVEDIDLAGVESGHGQWFYVVAAQDPSLGFSVAEHVLSHENCSLTRYASPMMHALWISDEGRFLAFAQRVATQGRDELKAGLAYAYSYSDWFNKPRQQDFELLKKLLASRDGRTKYHAMQAMRRLGDPLRKQEDDDKNKRRSLKFARKGVELLLSVDIGEDANLAEALCEALDPKFGISPELLTKPQAGKLLRRLVPIGDVTHQAYHMTEVLGFFAGRTPDLLFDFFINRIRFAAKRKSAGGNYSAIPFGIDGLFSAIEGSDVQETLLRKARDELVNSKGLRSYWFAELFKLVAGGYGAPALKVISELEQDRSDATYRTIAILLSNAPNGFIFARKDFCAGLLERSNEVSGDSYDRIASTLAASAETGVFSAVPGQPSPKHVGIRENASALAEEFKNRHAVASFFGHLARSAQTTIDEMLRRDEEEFVE